MTERGAGGGLGCWKQAGGKSPDARTHFRKRGDFFFPRTPRLSEIFHNPSFWKTFCFLLCPLKGWWADCQVARRGRGQRRGYFTHLVFSCDLYSSMRSIFISPLIPGFPGCSPDYHLIYLLCAQDKPITQCQALIYPLPGGAGQRQKRCSTRCSHVHRPHSATRRRVRVEWGGEGAVALSPPPQLGGRFLAPPNANSPGWVERIRCS